MVHQKSIFAQGLAIGILSLLNSSGVFAQSEKFLKAKVECGLPTYNETQISACTTVLAASGLSDDFLATVYYNRAYAYYRTRKYDLALPDLDQSIRLSQDKLATAKSYMTRGSVFSQMQEFSRAISNYSQAMVLDPLLRDPLLTSRAMAFTSVGDQDSAIADLTSLIDIREQKKDARKLAESYFIRGVSWTNSGDPDRGVPDLSKAIQIDSTYPEPHLALGVQLRLRGDYSSALKEYERAIAKDPDGGLGYMGRGETRRLQGDLEGALADFNEAVRLTPQNPIVYIYRGDAFRYLGEIDKSIEDYNASLAIQSSTITAILGRGISYEKNGNYVLAKEDFQNVLNDKRMPNSPIANEAKATARAHIAALNSGVVQPVIPSAPPKAKSQTAVPTPEIIAPILTKPLAPASGKGAFISQGRRVALVIGNSAYRNVSALLNPTNDAGAIADSLRNIGFEIVTLASDATREKLIEGLRAFAHEAEKADWAMVYYAGHGIEVGGVNYLIPVDAKLAVDRDIQFEAVPLDQVLATVDGAKKLKLVVLDACRNNPFQTRKTTVPEPVAANAPTAGAAIASRSVGRGLAEVKVTGATLVVYAAKNGQVALDGDGRNSPFAVAVVQRLATPGVEINKLFRLVRDDVMEATAGRQEPYTYGSLPGREDFFFVNK